MKNDVIVILDFGGQYNQLIARKVREANVYCEILPYYADIERIRALSPKGIILSGLEDDDNGEAAVSSEIFGLKVPVLGICYGAKLLCRLMGGAVSDGGEGEFGLTDITLGESDLFEGIDKNITCRMDQTDCIVRLPEGFTATAHTKNCPVAAFENKEKRLYGLQFHPVIKQTPKGREILKNFLYKICNLSGDWNISELVQNLIEEIREKVGDKKVLCALSGGVDSSVSAVLVSKAIGKQLTCIFVDHGLMRKNEGDEVEKVFSEQYDLNFIRVNRQDRFLDKLKGVTDPEQKRKIIGEEFIRVFEIEAKKIGAVDYLVQGTIYPDIIESGMGKNKVKSHHNVGGLPERLGFKELIEPLRNLFKDEVRQLGLQLGLPENLVFRQPFPGPGLAVRVIGEVTKKKLDILRDADAIFREEISKAGLDREINQYFAILTGMKSVGVRDGKRTYDYTVALRAVTTTDFMTADWAQIPYSVLETVSSRIVNEVDKVNRVVYDITCKPPATIEWE